MPKKTARSLVLQKPLKSAMVLSHLCKQQWLAQQNRSSCYQDDSSYEDKYEDKEEEEQEQEQEQQEQERPQGRGQTLADEFRQSILQHFLLHSGNGWLHRGAVNTIARGCGVHRNTVSSIWSRALESV